MWKRTLKRSIRAEAIIVGIANATAATEKRLCGGSLDVPAEKSLKTIGDEMQVDLEDAGKKEAEEKEVDVLTAVHGNRHPWQRWANPSHKLSSSRRRREARKVAQGQACSSPHD